MSNALALAAVSAVLKDLLDNAMIDQSISTAVGAPVVVSTLPPDRIETGDNEVAGLNLFLYRTSPNAALRNAELPSRNGRGRRLTNPPLALDLHYLVSAYGAQDLDCEILLGYAMQLLHETPVLSRDAIRRTLRAPSPVGGGLLPDESGVLDSAALAEQIEMLKITPEPLGTEELSKLWTAFQAKYRPCAAYTVSVVLIEARQPVAAALPVLTRGPADAVTGRERGIIAHASVEPPYPTLLEVTPPDAQPGVRMGETLTLNGRHLDGDAVAARFVHVRSGRALELDAEPGGTARSFDVAIPPDPPAGAVTPDSPQDPASWRIGVYAVAGIVRTAGEPERSTNTVPLALAPAIVPQAPVANADGTLTVTVDVRPPVHAGQDARLLVGSLEAPADAFAGDTTSSLSFTSASFPAGDQWLRLRVDGVESLLVDRGATPPAFDASQQVTIP